MNTQPSRKKDDYDTAKNFRAKFETESALAHAVAAMRQRSDLPFRGGRINAQALVNASWLWLEYMSRERPDELVAKLGPHVGRLESLLRGEGDPGYAEPVAEPLAVGVSKSKPDRADSRARDVGAPVRVRRKR